LLRIIQILQITIEETDIFLGRLYSKESFGSLDI